MKKEEKERFVKHKIEKAEEALEEVTLLYGIAHYSTCAGRLYYAAFYGASALLAKRDFFVKSHAGIRRELGQSLVKTGLLDRNQGKLFSNLFDLRQLSDYGNIQDVSKEQLDAVLTDGIALVKKLIALST